MWNNVIGMPDRWLRGTPFTSWVVPGAFLLLVVAVPMGMAAVVEASRSAWAALASISAGAAQVGWIGAELLMMQRYNVLQPVMLGVGLDDHVARGVERPAPRNAPAAALQRPGVSGHVAH